MRTSRILSPYLFVIIFTSLSNNILSQNSFFVNIDGNSDDASQSLIINKNGEYIIGGHTNSFGMGSYDLYLLKLDEYGNLNWNKTYGNDGMDGIREIAMTDDSGYVLGGYAGDGNYWDFLVMRVDSVGNPKWAKTIGGFDADECNAVAQTNDNGIIATGYTKSYGSLPGGKDIYLVKFSYAGEIEWGKAMGSSSDDWGHYVKQTQDGGYLILGFSNQGYYYNDYDIVLIKTDPLGSISWTNIYSLDGNEYAFEFKETPDGCLVIAGYTENRNIFLIKTDSIGSVKWAKRFLGSESCYAYSLNLCSDGGFIIGGRIGYDDYDALMIRTDENGNIMWSRKYAGSGSESFADIKETFDKGFLACGNANSIENYSNNLIIIKTDSTGQSECVSSLIKLKSQQFTPTAYQIFDFHSVSGGVVFDWQYNIINPTPKITYSCITNIRTDLDLKPSFYSLEQNYPNPFNPTTKINFALPQRGVVILKVYDLLGREIETLVNEEKEAGYYDVIFDGSEFSSGTYIYTLNTGNFRESKKLLLIK